MKDIYVIYFSNTGNTETMAQAVAEGIRAAGANAKVEEVGHVSPEVIEGEVVFALGCPACGAEELDESIESFMDGISGMLKGKQVGLFGSYGWGDGDWMREWEKRVSEAGGSVVGGAGVIANESPDDAVISACKNLGKELAR